VESSLARKSINTVFTSVEDIDEPSWIGRAEQFLSDVLKKRGHINWELSVLFCSDAYIQSLNRNYRDKDCATDVLSFEQGVEYTDDGGKVRYIAGDIALSIEFLYKNSIDFDVLPDEELKRLLIHGILHLEGLDHGVAHIGEEQNEMFKCQEQLVQAFQEYTIIG